VSNFLKNAGYDSEEVYFYHENQKLIQEAKKTGGQKQSKTENSDPPNNVIPIDRAKKAKGTAATKKRAA
jgi:hypothetical protein